jgi:hypothetical protein
MMHFALCKEQQHSQKQDFFVILVLDEDVDKRIGSASAALSSDF